MEFTQVRGMPFVVSGSYQRQPPKPSGRSYVFFPVEKEFRYASPNLVKNWARKNNPIFYFVYIQIIPLSEE